MILTREDFVDICKKAITRTRELVIPLNQVSGFRKYSSNVDSGEFQRFRRNLTYTGKNKADYKLIKQYGVGACSEFSMVLLYLIAKEMNKIGVNPDSIAFVYLKAAGFDHCFLNICVRLDGETSGSVWEVDAWDPRIIDKSLITEEIMNNSRNLMYGVNPIYRSEILKLSDINFDKIDIKIEKARPNCRADTRPAAVIIDNEQKIYNDLTIERALKIGNLPAEELSPLQKCSIWQKEFPSDNSEFSYRRSRP